MSSPDQETRFALLLRSSQNGDTLAYHELLIELTPIIRGYTRRLIFNDALVEEATQEVLLAIHKARHTYQPDKRFFPWFSAILHHRCVDYIRTAVRGRRIELLDIEQANNIADGTKDDLELSEKMDLALQQLPEKQQTALRLLKVEGLSTKEAARKLNMSESALKVMVHRAYKVLRERLRP